MRYIKPQVTILGAAAELIGGFWFKSGLSLDGRSFRAIVPAYDLDE